MESEILFEQKSKTFIHLKELYKKDKEAGKKLLEEIFCEKDPEYTFILTTIVKKKNFRITKISKNYFINKNGLLFSRKKRDFELYFQNNEFSLLLVDNSPSKKIYYHTLKRLKVFDVICETFPELKIIEDDKKLQQIPINKIIKNKLCKNIE